MYNQLLYLITAILLFTVQQPGTTPFLSAPRTLALGLALYGCYALICRMSFRRIALAADQGIPQTAVTIRYHRTQAYLSLLAILFFALDVYLLDVRFYIDRLPWMKQSITLSGMTGIALFLIHQAAAWYWGYPAYRSIHRSSMSRPAFIMGQLSFSSSILVPWILISFASDMLQAFGTAPFLATDAGQFALLALLLPLFILFAPTVVVRLWGCRPIPEGPVRAELEQFCKKNRFRVGNLLLWPIFSGEMLTAAIVGILPRFRYILITRGLLNILTTDELKAVVAHEMGHVRKFHLVVYLVFFLLYARLSLFFYPLISYVLDQVTLLLFLEHEPFMKSLVASGSFLTVLSLLYTIPLVLLLILYIRFILGFFLRNSERQADHYAAQLVGHPFTLISSFQKIAFYSGQMENVPSWHHYSIRERIDFLRDSYGNPSVIARHNRKLYGASLIYIGLMSALIGLSLEIEQTKLFQHWNSRIEISMVERGLSRNPANAELKAIYGGMLFEEGRIGEAETTLRQALELAPSDGSALNNLAWLYATSKPPHFDPQEALDLALRAVSVKPEPHVLDTLAEAYYVNGRYRDALEVIEKALSMEPEMKESLERKEKILKALGRE